MLASPRRAAHTTFARRERPSASSHLHDESLCVDLVPENCIPAAECLFDMNNAVPELFEQLEVLLAFVELIVVAKLHIEELHTRFPSYCRLSAVHTKAMQLSA